MYCVLFVVLCIVCCVSQYCVVPTIKCKFVQQNLIFFHKNINMLRIWCRYAVIPLAGLSRRSAGRWRPRACHATNHNNFIYQPIFTIFAGKKFSNKQAIIILKNINIMFNKTIWILTFFFLRDPLKC